MLAQRSLFVFLFCLSCTTKEAFPIRSPKASNSNLAFGFMKYAWNGSSIEVSIATVGKVKDAYDARAHVYDNGLFFVEGLASGKHRLGAGGWSSDFEFEVNRGGLTYVGSFAATIDSRYQGKVVTAILTPLNSPDQFTMLCRLEAAVKDNPWYFIVLGYHEDMYQDRSCTPKQNPVKRDELPLKDPFSK
jgi:hypothetical protein